MAALTVDSLNSVVSGTPNTSDGTYVGSKSTSKVGFFGATPVVKNATPFDLSSGTVAELAAILAAYGLITTQA